jgi:ABC-2 type transport system permease protein
MGMFGSSWLRVRAVAVKELWGLLRQPQLLLLLLLGPVLIMVAFALSFSTENILPRAVVVVEEGSEGEELFEEYSEQFTGRTQFQGVMRSVEEADAALNRGETDAVIIIPPEPSATVLEGEQAVLEVHYATINPVFGTTVPNRANGLVLDLNQQIVRAGVTREIENIRLAREQFEEISAVAARIDAAAETLASEEAQDITTELAGALTSLESTLTVLEREGPEESQTEVSTALDRTQEVREVLEEVREAQEEGADEIKARTGARELEAALSELGTSISEVPDVSPSVLVNPFRLELENLVAFEPEVVEFYVPGVLGILIQHIALSLASLAIVRERTSGAYEFFEVSPLGAGEILAGKFLTYAGMVLAVNLAVAAALVYFLNIPVQGSYLSVAGVMVLLTVSSLGVGFLLSTLARSQLQAIQFAMLLLIASGFFAGFLFPLDEMTQPAQSIAYFLPATYGIQALQDTMLRGTGVSPWTLAGFAAIILVSFGLSRFLLRRKKR